MWKTLFFLFILASMTTALATIDLTTICPQHADVGIKTVNVYKEYNFLYPTWFEWYKSATLKYEYRCRKPHDNAISRFFLSIYCYVLEEHMKGIETVMCDNIHRNTIFLIFPADEEPAETDKVTFDVSQFRKHNDVVLDQ